MILGLVAVLVLTWSMFTGRFVPTATVTVETARSGLVLDPEAAVRFRGAEIGRVGGIERVGQRVRLRLDLDPDLLALVPANVRIDIRSTTVFGAKYVDFVAPARPVAEPLRPGAVVRAESVTVEFDTLFQRLTDVLAQIDPARLNATLTAIGTALHGRGATLGDLLTRADGYLREINPHLPALRHDMASTAAVTGIYAETAPDLLRTLGNATVTSATVAEQAIDMDALLLDLIGMADTSGAVLGENEQPLVAGLELLAPTAELLFEYRPVLECVIVGLVRALPLAEAMIGGRQPGAIFNASFMYGGEAYKYPEDAPKVNATGGPRCDGVLDRVPGSHAPYVVTDTAESDPYAPTTTLRLNEPTVFQVLFAGLPGLAPR
ncbi:MCE family protein [Nocardia cyriacigeorgica]|uniref:MCE family protein n=1 Tax=Nocardia cyriacigeorgica TaxID=135487 RepID=UPI002458D11A|nr:MCE family protein [Nocardia cyriacigeorgica]